MRAIIVSGPTAADWRETTVPDSDALETYQRAVGGLIEALPTIDSARATVYINEEGKINGLPPMAAWVDETGHVLDILRGSLVLLGPVDDEGNTTGLTDEALAYIREQVRPLADHPEWAEMEQREGFEILTACPNCGQWQREGNGGDCLNGCARRGFAPFSGR